MATIERTEKRVYTFDEMVTSWKQDHENAKAQTFNRIERREVETLMDEAIDLWEDVCHLHEDWVNMVMDGEVAPDLALDKRMYKLFVNCHEINGKLNSMLDRLLFNGIEFQNSQRFRECFEDSRETTYGLTEPSTPVAPIPRDAGKKLASNCDMTRYE